MSEALFQYRSNRLRPKIERNRRLASVAAVMMAIGSIAFIASRFISKPETIYLALSSIGLCLFVIGSIALFRAVINWKLEDKCPVCGKLFWGNRHNTRIGFNPITTSCIHCGHTPDFTLHTDTHASHGR